MLSRFPHARLAGLVILLAIPSGCRAKPPAAARQAATLTPVAQEIERRGYHSNANGIVPPTSWEVATFRMRSKRSFSFRADQPLPNSPDTFCRFRFFEETYDSAEDARNRLANLHLPAPDGPAEERDYLSAMRTGFRIGKVAYILQTDGSIFWDEVQRLAKALANATEGAEMAPL
jgi:hypothetical protein